MTPEPINSPSPPNLPDLFAQFRQNLLVTLNCHQVGEIVSWDRNTQSASVKIKMMRLVGSQQIQYPILTHCPVHILCGGAGRVTFPIAAGDPCLILFNDRDLDNWFESGADAVPNSFRTHSLSDGLVIVGFRNSANKLVGISATDTELGQGNTVVGMDGAKISVRNGSTSLKLALDDLFTNLDDLMVKLKAWINTGGSTPNPATITALGVAQANFATTKATVDSLLK